MRLGFIRSSHFPYAFLSSLLSPFLSSQFSPFPYALRFHPSFLFSLWAFSVLSSRRFAVLSSLFFDSAGALQQYLDRSPSVPSPASNPPSVLDIFCTVPDQLAHKCIEESSAPKCRRRGWPSPSQNLRPQNRNQSRTRHGIQRIRLERGEGGSSSGSEAGRSKQHIVEPWISVVTAGLGFLTNFEDVYRLWAFVSRFLDADFVEKGFCH